MIRAVLTSEGTHAGIKHNLEEMVDLVPDGNPLKPLLRDIELLAAFATTYRYPSPAGKVKASPSPTDMAKYLADVETALAEAVTRFGVDLSDQNAPATKAGPIRQPRALRV